MTTNREDFFLRVKDLTIVMKDIFISINMQIRHIFDRISSVRFHIRQFYIGNIELHNENEQ